MSKLLNYLLTKLMHCQTKISISDNSLIKVLGVSDNLIQIVYLCTFENGKSKHLKVHLAPRVSHVTFLDQMVIPGSL